MKELVIILLIALICFIVYLVIKHKIKHKTETITAYTGGLGSGKTLFSVDKALKIYRKQLRKQSHRKLKNKIRNSFIFWRIKPFNEEKPLLFSNIPIKMGYKKVNGRKEAVFSCELTKEILLLQERIPLNSVILIDEIGAFANQFDFKEKNVIDTFDEFCRFYRHYTKGGYLVVNDQCSENINLVIRRRLNTIHNLSNCFVLWRFCFYFERMINISEEIKTIDMSQNDIESDTQDNMNFRFRFLWNKNNYDTYCYSERYNKVPKLNIFSRHKQLKTNKLLKCPKDKDIRYYPKTEERSE